MNFVVTLTPKFISDLDFYKNKLKHKKIDSDIQEVIESLKDGSLVGDSIPELKLPEDESAFKVRMVNSSMKVGKRKGYRIIYYVIKNEKEIFLLTIYSKQEKGNISTKEIVGLIEQYCK